MEYTRFAFQNGLWSLGFWTFGCFYHSLYLKKCPFLQVFISGLECSGAGGHLQPIVRPGKFLYGDCDFDEELFVSMFDNV